MTQLDEGAILFALLLILIMLILYCVMLFGRHTPRFLGNCKKCGCKWWEDKIVRPVPHIIREGWHCKSCGHFSGRYTGTLHDYGGM